MEEERTRRNREGGRGEEEREKNPGEKELK